MGRLILHYAELYDTTGVFFLLEKTMKNIYQMTVKSIKIAVNVINLRLPLRGEGVSKSKIC